MVSDGCEKIFFALYLKKNPAREKFIIWDFNHHELSVISPEFNIDRRIRFKEVKDLVEHEVVEKELILKFKK